MRTQLLLLALPSLCHASTSDQIPFPNSKMSNQPEIQTHSQPSLADLLTIEPTASIFYSYARELELSSQFGTSDEGKWTLLVPTNKAVMALSRKPWVPVVSTKYLLLWLIPFCRHEDPAPTEPVIEMSEHDFDSVSKRNVERWVSAHIIPVRRHFNSRVRCIHWLPHTQRCPIALTSHTYKTLLCGKSVTFDPVKGNDDSAPEWTRVVFEDNARIIGMKTVCVVFPPLSIMLLACRSYLPSSAYTLPLLFASI